MIRRDVAVALAVEIALADGQRIDAQMAGDLIHHMLDPHHALRTAETPESGVGDRVRLAAMGNDPHMVQVIRIVGMEHRAVGNRPRQVRRISAADRLHERNPLDTAVLVKPDIVVDPAMMPLAGQDHVVVAVQPVLHRPPGALRQQRRRHRDQRRLRLLAAKPAAHAPRLAHHRMIGQFQRPSDEVLHLGRVLRGAVHQHVAILAGDRHGDLPFEIEMLLPADIDAARKPQRRRRQRGIGIASLHHLGWQHEALRRQRLVNGQDRLQDLVFDHCLQGRFPGQGHAACGNREHRLAVILHQPVGKNWVAQERRTHVIDARHIPGRHDRGDARHRRDRGQVDRLDPRMSVRAERQ